MERHNFEAHEPRWMVPFTRLMARDGNFVIMHAVSQGAQLVDVSAKSASYEASDREARENKKRLSWGLPSFMRKCYKDRCLSGCEGDQAFTEFLDLVHYPGFKGKGKPTFNYQRNETFLCKF